MKEGRASDPHARNKRTRWQRLAAAVALGSSVASCSLGTALDGFSSGRANDADGPDATSGEAGGEAGERGRTWERCRDRRRYGRWWAALVREAEPSAEDLRGLRRAWRFCGDVDEVRRSGLDARACERCRALGPQRAARGDLGQGRGGGVSSSSSAGDVPQASHGVRRARRQARRLRRDWVHRHHAVGPLARDGVLLPQGARSRLPRGLRGARRPRRRRIRGEVRQPQQQRDLRRMGARRFW